MLERIMLGTRHLNEPKWSRATLPILVGTLVVMVGSTSLGADDNITSTTSAATAKYTAKAGFDIDGEPLPAGVIARLGTKRFRGGEERTAGRPEQLNFLSDNKSLVQVTANGWLKQRDALSGRLLRQFL